MPSTLVQSPRRILVLLLFLSLPFTSGKADTLPGQGKDVPSVVLFLIFDGLSYEQLMENQHRLTPGGFRRLMSLGASIENAHFGYAETSTAPGHATILTGAYPEHHGIVANRWFDRSLGAEVYATLDPEHYLLGDRSFRLGGQSPRNLLLSTVGDSLLESPQNRSRVFSISTKDRAAVMAGGHKGKAYFYNERSGRFITTSYYAKDYPPWWKTYYREEAQKKWVKRLKDEWHIESATLNDTAYTALPLSILGEAYFVEFVEALIDGEGIGKNPHGHTDVLILSFSGQDLINHLQGPESEKAIRHLIGTDRILSAFLKGIDRRIGLDNALIVLTADHGFSKTVETCRNEGHGGGRIAQERLVSQLRYHLSSTYGIENLLRAWTYPTFYLNDKAMKQNGLDRKWVETRAAKLLETHPGILKVFTRTELLSHPSGDHLERQVRRSWHEKRSGDLYVVVGECWTITKFPGPRKSSHGSPHAYDTHVPLIFAGRWFKPGRYAQAVDLVDVAPTVAHLMGLDLSDTADGRILTEILRD